MKLWLCGQSFHDKHPQAWDFQGIFDSEEKAVAACVEPTFWITEIELNAESSVETVPFEGKFYYPRFNYQTKGWEDESKIRHGYEA